MLVELLVALLGDSLAADSTLLGVEALAALLGDLAAFVTVTGLGEGLLNLAAGFFSSSLEARRSWLVSCWPPNVVWLSLESL